MNKNHERYNRHRGCGGHRTSSMQKAIWSLWRLLYFLPPPAPQRGGSDSQVAEFERSCWGYNLDQRLLNWKYPTLIRGFLDSTTAQGNRLQYEEPGFESWSQKVPLEECYPPVFLDYLVAQMLKNLPTVREGTGFDPLGWGRSPEGGQQPTSSISCLENPPWTEEPGWLQSTRSEVGHSWRLSMAQLG